MLNEHSQFFLSRKRKGAETDPYPRSLHLLTWSFEGKLHV